MSYIYIIGPIEHENKSLKVGVTKNDETLSQRLKSLQTGHPEKLIIHYTREVADDISFTIEKIIHNEIKFDKTLNEWFDVSLNDLKQDIDFIFIRYGDVKNLKQKYRNRDRFLVT